MVHKLLVTKKHFEAIEAGMVMFCCKKSDDGFSVGDYLELHKAAGDDESNLVETGDMLIARIAYLSDDEHSDDDDDTMTIGVELFTDSSSGKQNLASSGESRSALLIALCAFALASLAMYNSSTTTAGNVFYMTIAFMAVIAQIIVVAETIVDKFRGGKND